MRSAIVQGIAAALVVVLIWAASFSLARQAIDHLGPWMFRLYSMGVGLLPVLPFLRPASRALFALDAICRRRVLLSTTLTGTVVATMNLVALDWYPASTVLVLMYTMPAFASVLDAWQVRGPLLRALFPPAAALMGVIMFASSGTQVLGPAACVVLLNALLWAIGTRLADASAGRLSPPHIVTVQMTIAFLSAIPMGVICAIRGEVVIPSAIDLAGIGWAGLLNGGLVFWLWYIAIARLGASRTAWFTLLVPLLGSAIAVAVFGEILDARQKWGLVLISTSVLLHLLYRREKQTIGS